MQVVTYGSTQLYVLYILLVVYNMSIQLEGSNICYNYLLLCLIYSRPVIQLHHITTAGAQLYYVHRVTNRGTAVVYIQLDVYYIQFTL